MNRQTVAFVLFVSMLGGSFGAAGAAAAPGGATLDTVNLALKGRAATIVLAAEKVVPYATSVVVGPDTTSWQASGQRQARPTAQVVRIRTHRRGGFIRSLGLGLGVGAGAGLATVGGHECNGFCPGPRSGDVVLAFAAAGGLIGGVIGAFRHGEPAEVVFEGPVERYLAASQLNAAATRAHELSHQLFGLQPRPN